MAAAPGGTYHEFQVSPLNQYLELRILEPRVRVDREFRCAGLDSTSLRKIQG